VFHDRLPALGKIIAASSRHNTAYSYVIEIDIKQGT
jgi:hypothetical protein